MAPKVSTTVKRSGRATKAPDRLGFATELKPETSSRTKAVPAKNSAKRGGSRKASSATKSAVKKSAVKKSAVKKSAVKKTAVKNTTAAAHAATRPPQPWQRYTPSVLHPRLPALLGHLPQGDRHAHTRSLATLDNRVFISILRDILPNLPPTALEDIARGRTVIVDYNENARPETDEEFLEILLRMLPPAIRGWYIMDTSPSSQIYHRANIPRQVLDVMQTRFGLGPRHSGPIMRFSHPATLTRSVRLEGQRELEQGQLAAERELELGEEQEGHFDAWQQSWVSSFETRPTRYERNFPQREEYYRATAQRKAWLEGLVLT